MHNIFEEVKEQVSARQVAEYYGLRVNPRGMACCPFHEDRHPSFLIDRKHYHCFGCGAHGDVISYVERLFGIRPVDAVKKIAGDFSLAVDLHEDRKTAARRCCESRFRRRRKNKEENAWELYERWVINSVRTLRDCDKSTRDIAEKMAPTSFDEEWTEAFTQALALEPKIAGHLDTLCTGEDTDRVNLYLGHRKEVRRIVEEVHRLAGKESGGGSGPEAHAGN